VSRATGGPRANLSAWGVEKIRLTTFHASFAKAEGWWESMTNQEPDSRVSKKGGDQAEIGPWEGLVLALTTQAQAGRIDWLASEPVGETINPPSLTERLPAFSDLAKRWLVNERLPQPTNRMAFGLIVHLPVANLEEGYRRLSDYLPFDIDRATSSDFLYQLNRPRDSTTLPGVRINRLTKWSVGLFFLQAVRLSGSGVSVSNDRGPERCGCRLELDINTVFNEETPSLPHDSLQALFGEMVALSQEIISEGDIP
jgi:hypothetical protein